MMVTTNPGGDSGRITEPKVRSIPAPST